MKKLFTISILVLIIIAISIGCTSSSSGSKSSFEISPQLKRLDSLMQSRPDSALMILLSLDKACLLPTGCDDLVSRTANACVGALLLSEALYKTDNPQDGLVETHGRASLQTAMRYFDSLMQRYPNNDDIIMFSARAHYMNGVGFYENDSVIEACKEYLHTLEIMEDHFEEKDLVEYKAKFMGLTYTRLGEVYYYYGIAQATVELYKNALLYFNRTHNYNLANTYRHIGGSYRYYNNNDSALHYYREAIRLAKKQNNITIYGASLSESAPIYYNMGYKDSAFLLIKKALSLPIVDDARLAQYYTLGLLFEEECQYDSAIFYLEKSLRRINYATQTASADLLMKCCQAIGDTTKAQYYKSIYGNNFSQFRNNSIIETELVKIYETYKVNRLQIINNINVKSRTKQTVLILFSILIVIITMFYKIKIHNTIVKSNQNIAAKNKTLEAMKRKMEANPFINEPICKCILETTHIQQFKSKVSFDIYKEFALSKEQLLLLRDAVNRHYNNFTQRLKNEYPELTYDDIDYCCLYLLGLKDADVSAFKQRSYRAVSDRNKKLKHIFKTNLTVSIYLNYLVNDYLLD